MANSLSLVWIASLGFAGAFLILLPLRFADPRLIEGERVWTKPLKFAASLSLHFATIALVLDRLPVGADLRSIVQLSVLAAIAEFIWIALNASQARRSHFDVSSRTRATLYFTMAVAAFFVLLPAPAIAVQIFLEPPMTWPLAVRIGVGLGFMGGAILTVVTAYRLGGNGGRYVGKAPSRPVRMPLTGWTLNAADLRIPHFLALHTLQIIPATAVVISLVEISWIAIAAVWLASASWGLFVIISFTRTLSGRPLAYEVQ